MKKLLLLSIFALSALAAFSQAGSQAVSGIKFRVLDSAAYRTAATVAHTQGYADMYFNAQATTPHFDIWNGVSYTHVFDFNAGGGGGITPVTGSGLTWSIDRYNLGGTLTGNVSITTGANNFMVHNDNESIVFNGAGGSFIYTGISTQLSITSTGGLSVTGPIRFVNLAGTGNRMVMADADGDLSTVLDPRKLPSIDKTASFVAAIAEAGVYHYNITPGGATTITFPGLTGLEGLQWSFWKNVDADAVVFDFGAETANGATALPDTSWVYVNWSDGRFKVAGTNPSTGGAGGSVITDGVTITGDGTSGDPLVASGLQPGNNLSDVSSPSTSRGNIRALGDVNEYNNINTDYSIATTDFPYANAGVASIIQQSSASPNNVTINATTLSAVPDGSYFYYRRQGAGITTFVPAGGASFTSSSGGLVDAGLEQLNVIEKTGATTFAITNGGFPLGTSNQLLGVNNAGNAQEYKTVDNGITSSAGTLKLGGALTANTNLSGAFSLGIGASPSAKLHVAGLGTTTGGLALFEDNGGTDRLSILDNGKHTQTNTQSGSGVLGYDYSSIISSSANSQTINGYSFKTTATYGANTGVTANLFSFSDTGAANPYWTVIQGTSGASTSQNWNSAGTYNFANGASTAIIRNSAGALSLRGGTTSTTRMLQLTTTSASSVNDNAAFNFTGNIHNYGTAVTRTNTAILHDYSVTAVNGCTIDYYTDDYVPTFSVGNSTLTVHGPRWNPSITGSGTIINYAPCTMAGSLTGLGTFTPTATLHVVGSEKVDGNLTLVSAGNGIYIKEGTDATMGVATLSSGTITVNTTKVTANSRIFLTIQGGTLTNVGSTYISDRSAGTSFTISSTNILDSANVAWMIIEPTP